MATRETLIATARDLPLLAALNERELGQLLDRVLVVELEPGQTLFEEGDASDGMYVVVSGRLRVSCRDGDGHSVEVGEVGPQSLVGEMGVLDPAPRSATVRAATAVSLVSVPSEAFTWLVDAGHPAALRVLTQMTDQVCARLRAVDGRLDEVFAADGEGEVPASPNERGLRRLWEALWLEKS